jgi:hypothetical protein
MRYSEGADLDTSGVQDRRRGGGLGGGHGLAVGGGGLGPVGVVVLVPSNCSAAVGAAAPARR